MPAERAEAPRATEELTDDARLGSFPASVGGIPFGAPQRDVERICRDAGGTVIASGRMRGHRTISCSIAPVDPFPGLGTFPVAYFCESAARAPIVCEVALEFVGATDASAHRVLQRLEEHHGPAHASRDDIECHDSTDRGRAFRGTWIWPPAAGAEQVPHGMVIATWGCASSTAGAPMVFAVFFKSAPMVWLEMRDAAVRQSNY